MFAQISTRVCYGTLPLHQPTKLPKSYYLLTTDGRADSDSRRSLLLRSVHSPFVAMAPLQGALPDRYGDWGLECLTTQDKTRREVAGTIVRARPKPPVFRPPEDFGGWSPQSGLGTKENRFEHRVHSKIPFARRRLLALRRDAAKKAGRTSTAAAAEAKNKT